jgi:hypothetical protein
MVSLWLFIQEILLLTEPESLLAGLARLAGVGQRCLLPGEQDDATFISLLPPPI